MEDFTFDWQYEREKNNPKYILSYLNLNHPSVTWENPDENIENEKGPPEYKLDELLDCIPQLVPDEEGRLQFFLGNQKSAFPDFKKIKVSDTALPMKGNLMIRLIKYHAMNHSGRCLIYFQLRL